MTRRYALHLTRAKVHAEPTLYTEREVLNGEGAGKHLGLTMKDQHAIDALEVREWYTDEAGDEWERTE